MDKIKQKIDSVRLESAYLEEKLPSTHKKLIAMMNFLSIIILVMLMTMCFMQYTRPNTKYSLINPKYQSKKNINVLEEPNVSTKSLLRWASTAATSSISMDFVNYQKTIEDIRKYYTNNGYNSFLESLEQSGRIQSTISKKLIVSAVVTSLPVVLYESVKNGAYNWKVQVPILVNYQGASENSFQEKMVVDLLITQVPISEAVTGIGIAQFTTRAILGQ